MADEMDRGALDYDQGDLDDGWVPGVDDLPDYAVPDGHGLLFYAYWVALFALAATAVDYSYFKLSAGQWDVPGWAPDVVRAHFGKPETAHEGRLTPTLDDIRAKNPPHDVPAYVEPVKPAPPQVERDVRPTKATLGEITLKLPKGNWVRVRYDVNGSLHTFGASAPALSCTGIPPTPAAKRPRGSG